MSIETPPITAATLQRMKRDGQKFACLTAYDATFASVLEEAGVEVVLVGDTLGMVVQGHGTTVPVSVDDVVYHTRLVARANRRALLMADMPFMSYASSAQALTNAARLMQEGGAHMVKLEATGPALEVVGALADHSIPVCAHLGLSPQSVHKLGGYRVQGRGEAAEAMLADARAMEAAGADIVLLECVPSALGETITAALSIPVIGIGAGPACDGQILVLYDMLGITPGRRPKFSKDFMAGHDSIAAAVAAYVQDVKSGAFPAPEHCFD